VQGQGVWWKEGYTHSSVNHVCRTIAAGTLVSIGKTLAKQSVVVCVHTPPPNHPIFIFLLHFQTATGVQIKTDLVVPSMH
jgi:hypothetical protein